ncbi:hypothetical protein CHUAL_008033 [Chamberlinius hualienensis]
MGKVIQWDFLSLALISVLLPLVPHGKADNSCSNDSITTFERITNISPTTSQFLSDELELVQSKSNETLQYDCHSLCLETANCVAYYVNHQLQTCRLMSRKLPSSDFPGDMHNSETHRGSYFEKICLQTGDDCARNEWVFDRVPRMELMGNDDIVVSGIESKLVCQQSCIDNKQLPCRSAEYYYDLKRCVLSRNNRRSKPNDFKRSSHNVDYLENQCIKVPNRCVYSGSKAMATPFPLAVWTSNDTTSNVEQCQQLCDRHSQFQCRSITFYPNLNKCYLSPDDRFSAQRLTVEDKDVEYYDKSDCVNVAMKCDATAMTALVTMEYPFQGKIYALLNPYDCSTTTHFEHSDHQVALTLPLRTSICGTKNLGNGVYTNSIVIQHHPNVLRSSDRRIDVVCEYEEHRIRLKAGKQILESDIANISSVVTGVAPTPDVRMRLIDADGNDIFGVDLGTEIILRIELMDERIYGIIGSGLVARSGDGTENITLIDEYGCPIETNVFPALKLSNKGSKALEAPFQAFRFASDSTVRFQITISFCLNECNPAICNTDEEFNATSYGRRRKRSVDDYYANVVLPDLVMEGSLFVRAKLERKEIMETNHNRWSSDASSGLHSLLIVT